MLLISVSLGFRWVTSFNPSFLTSALWWCHNWGQWIKNENVGTQLYRLLLQWIACCRCMRPYSCLWNLLNFMGIVLHVLQTGI